MVFKNDNGLPVEFEVEERTPYTIASFVVFVRAGFRPDPAAGFHCDTRGSPDLRGAIHGHSKTNDPETRERIRFGVYQLRWSMGM